MSLPFFRLAVGGFRPNVNSDTPMLRDNPATSDHLRCPLKNGRYTDPARPLGWDRKSCPLPAKLQAIFDHSRQPTQIAGLARQSTGLARRASLRRTGGVSAPQVVGPVSFRFSAVCTGFPPFETMNRDRRRQAATLVSTDEAHCCTSAAVPRGVLPGAATRQA